MNMSLRRESNKLTSWQMTVANWVSSLIKDSLNIKLFYEQLKVYHVFLVDYLFRSLLRLWIFGIFNNWAPFWTLSVMMDIWLFGSFVFFYLWICRCCCVGSQNWFWGKQVFEYQAKCAEWPGMIAELWSNPKIPKHARTKLKPFAMSTHPGTPRTNFY